MLNVDDLLLTGSILGGINQLKQLMKRFEMTDLRNVALYLGVEFNKLRNGVFLTQKSHCLQVLREFNMIERTSASIPMLVGLKLGAEECSSVVDAKRFQRLVGILIYLVTTKPKIFFVTGVMSRFMQSPRVPHLKAANHVLRYIKGALEFGIYYKNHESPTSIGHTDSDWDNYRIDRKSITDWVFKSAGGPISWSSKINE